MVVGWEGREEGAFGGRGWGGGGGVEGEKGVGEQRECD